VDVYNNLYQATDEDTYSYSIGVGVFAAVYAENNVVLRSADIPLDAFVFDWRGTQPGAMTEIGTLARVGTGAAAAGQPAGPVQRHPRPRHHRRRGLGADAAGGPAAATAQVQVAVLSSAGAGKLGI
jgi:pectate lyase